MLVKGYGCEVEWDGQTLTARGTNKMSHFAIAGKGHQGDVIIPAEKVGAVSLKRASALANGNVTVTTTEGEKYVLHFQKKHSADFAALAEQLPQVGVSAPEALLPHADVSAAETLLPDIEATKAKMGSPAQRYETRVFQIRLGKRALDKALKNVQKAGWEIVDVKPASPGEWKRRQQIVARRSIS
jgi:hypothetical protein